MQNQDYERQFTSTGEKLFRHRKVLKEMQKQGKASPIVMHVMPTSRCNLKCGFCSVKDRTSHETLDFDEVVLPTVDRLQTRGLKAVIFSGGGEPTLYKDFERMVKEVSQRGLEMGLITNGTLLDRVGTSVLEQLEWMRISINSLDYVDRISIPKLERPTLGFSYIVNEEDTTPEGLEKIRALTDEHDISYVRLLPDCAQPLGDLLKAHEQVGELAKRLGKPFFHQFKVHKTPESCYLGYVHPVLYCDGFIYPCDSLVLNDFEDQQFHKDFRLCRYDEIDQLYDKPVASLVDPKEMCPNCVFERQNTLLEGVVSGKTDPIPEVGPIKHENFV